MVSGKEYIYVVLLVVLILSLWASKRPKENRRSYLFPYKKKRGDELYGRLLSQVLGDKRKADRLIEYARSRNPELTEVQCIEMASDSLAGDIKRWD